MEIILFAVMFYVVLIIAIFSFIRIVITRLTKKNKDEIQQLEDKIKTLEDSIKKK